MKRYIFKALLAAFVAIGVSGCSMHSDVKKKDVSDLQKYEKNGFVTTKWCAERDYFKDCPLETFHCGAEGCWKDHVAGTKTTGEIVLYVHAERKIYNVEFKKPLKIYELEKVGFGRNDVTLKGYYDEASNTIVANDFDAPPPPKKEFYKGCL